MNILIVTQHFPPERGAVRRLFEFARYFAQNGHTVSVLTAMPNYPDGIVPEKYRGKFFLYEEIEGVKIYRCWVLAASNRNPGKRMIGFATFFLTSLINSFRLDKKFDVVLASTPPVNTPVIGWILSKIKGSKFIIEVRDLQPESSEDFGNLSKSWMTRGLKKVMHGLYRKADWIVSVTDGMTDYLRALPDPPSRITTVKSGFSKEFMNADYNGIRKKFGWDEKFIICRTGTLGWAHSLESVIEAARQLTDQPEIMFVFVGDGEKRGALEGMVRDYGLKNVAFVGSQPLETIPHFLQASNVLIESLKNVPLTRSTFPAKLFEYMASGRPILFGAPDGEAVRELEKAGGALAFHVDDVDHLCDLILKLKSGAIDGEELGEKYRSHADRHHHRDQWAREYLSVLKNVE
ncbi:MAG: glycosyltransferase family 4 protein [candidate division Zixibacteria bacterium]|nr:glycosyltransferase family 4 protein [candidate division Zixibacteria bacterium]